MMSHLWCCVLVYRWILCDLKFYNQVRIDMRFWLCLLVFLLPVTPLQAGEADVMDVKVTKQAAGIYRFDVTVKHGDTGWDHYADKWQVLLPGGEVIGTRILQHPHVDEQPFTRSLSDVKIPVGASKVIVRAHDKVHGASGKSFEVLLGDGG